ncbi:hypothetical protein ACYCAX_19425 [Pseudomonas sp. MT3]
MISALIAGRLVKAAHITSNGTCEATVSTFDDERSVRLSCRRKVLSDQLLALPFGSPVSVSGLLRVVPVLNDKGEPRAYLTLEVSAILTQPQPQGLMARLFKQGAHHG